MLEKIFLWPKRIFGVLLILFGLSTFFFLILGYINTGEAKEFYLLYWLMKYEIIKGDFAVWLWFPKEFIGLSVLLFEILYYIPTSFLPILFGYLIIRKNRRR